MIHITGEMKWVKNVSARFHCATQNSVQFKTYGGQRFISAAQMLAAKHEVMTMSPSTKNK